MFCSRENAKKKAGLMVQERIKGENDRHDTG